jgi:hypothetical protein
VHIGDQVFSLAVTDLIQQLYPKLRVVPASVRRSVIIPLSLGQVSHGGYVESEGSYEIQREARRDVKFFLLLQERT